MVATTILLSGLLAVIAGIVVLVWRESLNVAVGLYLILFGILRLLETFLP